MLERIDRANPRFNTQLFTTSWDKNPSNLICWKIRTDFSVFCPHKTWPIPELFARARRRLGRALPMTEAVATSDAHETANQVHQSRSHAPALARIDIYMLYHIGPTAVDTCIQSFVSG
jgi:hypothetical protein